MTPVFTFRASALPRFFFFVLAFLLASPLLHAQKGIQFVDPDSAPDTVCVGQKIQLTTTDSALSYYWTFCSGALSDTPTFTSIPNTFAGNGPTAIEAAKDDNGRYYAFILNQTDSTLVRLDFGTTLTNAPVYTVLTAFNDSPRLGQGLNLVRTGNDWYLFVTSSSPSTAGLTRLSFGTSLGNTPTAVNLGNPGNILSDPRDLYIQQEGTRFYGVILEATTSTIVRASFGTSITAVPVLQNLGNVGGMSTPQNLAVSKIRNTYRVYVTNTGNSTLTTLNFGTSLANTPTGVNSANLFNNLFNPTGIAYYRDADYPYLVIVNNSVNNSVRVQLDTNGEVTTAPLSVVTLLGNANDFSVPAGMTAFLRDSANLYTFVANTGKNSLTRINFRECTNASIGRSTSQTPAPFRYDAPGTYTVNLFLDEGLPTMRLGDNQLITVLPQPGIDISNDTLICQADTIDLKVQSISADSLRWTPGEAVSNATSGAVRAFPQTTTNYRIMLYYTNTCVIDTGITVRVVESVVDAGPDRTLMDGTTTVLGGPETSQGPQYSYRWSPSNYLDDSTKQFPVAQPFTNYTYYLTVITATPELTCRRTDSVVVRVLCSAITLPNAFAPASDIGGANRFGLLNKQLVRLISFKVFNRWGQEVYNSSDLTGGWDGMFNGKEAETGVYVWEVDGFCPDGQRIKQKGDVTLLR